MEISKSPDGTPMALTGFDLGPLLRTRLESAAAVASRATAWYGSGARTSTTSLARARTSMMSSELRERRRPGTFHFTGHFASGTAGNTV